MAWLLVYSQQRRRAAAYRFVEPAMAARLAPAMGGMRTWIKAAALLAGLAAMIVACARPRFGVYYERVAQRGVDLFILLDVSRSMAAEDVKPSRLERAKSDIRDLLPHLAGDRVGLIIYAGKPLVRVPLTTDFGFLLMALDDIDVNSAPRGGSLIGDAIRKCIEAMPRQGDRDQVMLMISDGEDQDSYLVKAAEDAAGRGFKIFTMGLGDSHEGARVPMRDEAGNRVYAKEPNGQEHWSKLNEKVLQEVALAAGGAYIPAGTRTYDLGQIYKDHLAGLVRGEYQSDKRKRYADQFQWFLGLGLVLICLEMAIPTYRRPTVLDRPQEDAP
jgi:Ca-activated chloride channel family protein